jgi:hypothetical protein
VLDTLRHEIAHALAGARRPPRTHLEGRCHTGGGHAPCLRDLGAGGHTARGLAGGLPGVRQDLPLLPAAEKPGPLPLPVRGTGGPDLRVHGRPGPTPCLARLRRGIGPVGGDLPGLRDGASEVTQAQARDLSVPLPRPL